MAVALDCVDITMFALAVWGSEREKKKNENENWRRRTTERRQ
ncbi:hypothetical protein [Halomontanus rarus]|nr:hypothetical protein [Halovivax sp. TS33]